MAFFGTHTALVRQKAHEYIFDKERKGATGVRIGADEWSSGIIVDAAGSAPLFGGEQIFILDTPSETKEFFDYVFASLDLLAQSSNTFVLIEGPLLAPERKKLQKHAKEAIEISAEKSERFNVFSLADALLRKDKKTLWLLLSEARRRGITDEEIIGTLLWQLKLLRLAARTQSAAEAGQKEFPYSKAKRALSAIQKEEADALSRELVAIYHEGHGGVKDLDLALEHWVLMLA